MFHISLNINLVAFYKKWINRCHVFRYLRFNIFIRIYTNTIFFCFFIFWKFAKPQRQREEATQTSDSGIDSMSDEDVPPEFRKVCSLFYDVKLLLQCFLFKIHVFASEIPHYGFLQGRVILKLWCSSNWFIIPELLFIMIFCKNISSMDESLRHFSKL